MTDRMTPIGPRAPSRGPRPMVDTPSLPASSANDRASNRALAAAPVSPSRSREISDSVPPRPCHAPRSTGASATPPPRAFSSLRLSKLVPTKRAGDAAVSNATALTKKCAARPASSVKAAAATAAPSRSGIVVAASNDESQYKDQISPRGNVVKKSGNFGKPECPRSKRFLNSGCAKANKRVRAENLNSVSFAPSSNTLASHDTADVCAPRTAQTGPLPTTKPSKVSTPAPALAKRSPAVRKSLLNVQHIGKGSGREGFGESSGAAASVSLSGNAKVSSIKAKADCPRRNSCGASAEANKSREKGTPPSKCTEGFPQAGSRWTDEEVQALPECVMFPYRADSWEIVSSRMETKGYSRSASACHQHFNLLHKCKLVPDEYGIAKMRHVARIKKKNGESTQEVPSQDGEIILLNEIASSKADVPPVAPCIDARASFVRPSTAARVPSPTRVVANHDREFGRSVVMEILTPLISVASTGSNQGNTTSARGGPCTSNRRKTATLRGSEVLRKDARKGSPEIPNVAGSTDATMNLEPAVNLRSRNARRNVTKPIDRSSRQHLVRWKDDEINFMLQLVSGDKNLVSWKEVSNRMNEVGFPIRSPLAYSVQYSRLRRNTQIDKSGDVVCQRRNSCDDDILNTNGVEDVPRRASSLQNVSLSRKTAAVKTRTGAARRLVSRRVSFDLSGMPQETHLNSSQPNNSVYRSRRGSRKRNPSVAELLAMRGFSHHTDVNFSRSRQNTDDLPRTANHATIKKCILFSEMRSATPAAKRRSSANPRSRSRGCQTDAEIVDFPGICLNIDSNSVAILGGRLVSEVHANSNKPSFPQQTALRSNLEGTNDPKKYSGLSDLNDEIDSCGGTPLPTSDREKLNELDERCVENRNTVPSEHYGNIESASNIIEIDLTGTEECEGSSRDAMAGCSQPAEDLRGADFMDEASWMKKLHDAYGVENRSPSGSAGTISKSMIDLRKIAQVPLVEVAVPSLFDPIQELTNLVQTERECEAGAGAADNIEVGEAGGDTPESSQNNSELKTGLFGKADGHDNRRSTSSPSACLVNAEVRPVILARKRSKSLSERRQSQSLVPSGPALSKNPTAINDAQTTECTVPSSHCRSTPDRFLSPRTPSDAALSSHARNIEANNKNSVFSAGENTRRNFKAPPITKGPPASVFGRASATDSQVGPHIPGQHLQAHLFQSSNIYVNDIAIPGSTSKRGGKELGARPASGTNEHLKPNDTHSCGNDSEGIQLCTVAKSNIALGAGSEGVPIDARSKTKASSIKGLESKSHHPRSSFEEVEVGIATPAPKRKGGLFTYKRSALVSKQFPGRVANNTGPCSMPYNVSGNLRLGPRYGMVSSKGKVNNKASVVKSSVAGTEPASIRFTREGGQSSNGSRDAEACSNVDHVPPGRLAPGDICQSLGDRYEISSQRGKAIKLFKDQNVTLSNIVERATQGAPSAVTAQSNDNRRSGEIELLMQHEQLQLSTCVDANTQSTGVRSTPHAVPFLSLNFEANNFVARGAARSGFEELMMKAQRHRGGKSEVNSGERRSKVDRNVEIKKFSTPVGTEACDSVHMADDDAPLLPFRKKRVAVDDDTSVLQLSRKRVATGTGLDKRTVTPRDSSNSRSSSGKGKDVIINAGLEQVRSRGSDTLCSNGGARRMQIEAVPGIRPVASTSTTPLTRVLPPKFSYRAVNISRGYASPRGQSGPEIRSMNFGNDDEEESTSGDVEGSTDSERAFMHDPRFWEQLDGDGDSDISDIVDDGRPLGEMVF